MSFEPQNLNTTLFRKPFYESQNKENELRLIQKKQLDDQIMNNILKINLFVFVVCLFMIGCSFFFDAEIVIYKLEEKQSQGSNNQLNFDFY